MIRIFKTSLSSSSDSPEGLTAELGQQASPGRRGFGPKSSGHRSPGGGASIFSNKRLSLPFLAFVAVLAAGLLFLLPGGLLQAQNDVYIDAYPENSKEPVATLTATDPESVRTIVWDLVPAASPPDGVTEADAEDAANFMISPNGVLTFAIGDDNGPPNYEAPADDGTNNNYKVTVKATDGGTMETISYFKVTVNVIDVEEDGKITATVAPGGTALNPAMSLLQFQPGAVLTPTLADSDVVTADSITWKWYRASSMTAEGTLIASTATYTVTDSPNGGDVGQYLKVMATYTDRRGGGKTATFTFPNPVQESRDVNRAPAFLRLRLTGMYLRTRRRGWTSAPVSRPPTPTTTP